MRLTEDTAKLRRSTGVEADAGRRATAGRKSLEAMVALVVKCVCGWCCKSSSGPCVRWRERKAWGFN